MDFLYKIFLYFTVYFFVPGTDHQVTAKCYNYWLDQYEDILPTINNRPDFPSQLTDAFQVSSFSNLYVMEQIFKLLSSSFTNYLVFLFILILFPRILILGVQMGHVV